MLHCFSGNRNGYKVTLFLICCFFMGMSSSAYGQAKKKVDTLKMANDLIKERKFSKVVAILTKYHKSHPKDFNTTFLLAQAELWCNNFRKSDANYKEALKLQPGNNDLKRSYIEFLLDLGKFDTASSLITKMEEDDKQSAPLALLKTKLFYWQGLYSDATAQMAKCLALDAKSAAAIDLNNEIALAQAPKVALNSGYVSDNQPYKAVISSLRFDYTFHRLLSLYVNVDDYRFRQSSPSDAQRFIAGDKLSFPKIGLQVVAGGGLVKYAYQSTTDWTANIAVAQKITQQLNLELFAERAPYFDTKTSIDTNITAFRFSSKLNWTKRNWKAQFAYLTSIYADDNYVNSAYAWIIAPLEITDKAQFHLGYSISYSNAYDSRYSSTQSVPEILSHYPDLTISGIYQPYFTPRNLWVNSIIATLHAKLSKKMDLGINADVGYATISNPFLYLTNSTGDVTIKRDFTTAFFKPFNALITLGYHIDNTWLVTAKYNYKTNYFYTSNFVGVGIEKSFLKNKRKAAPRKEPKSAYLNNVHKIEKELQALKKCKDAAELKKEVSRIKEQLTALRNEQKIRKDKSEMLPESEEAGSLDERYESLNDMLEDIASVDLNDVKGSDSVKKEWLNRKAGQLAAITYNGSKQE